NQAARRETISLYGKGEGRREYIYVKDLVDAIGLILARKLRGIYNIGMGVNYSHRELAEAINDVFTNTGNLQIASDRMEDKSICLMNSDKIKRELFWQPQWSLPDALLDMKTIMLSNADQPG
ncbi:MAG: GDP-mannose 4,6-dehydratase, partial [Desulfobacterales bacterium]|nr:GDP-mannose 4,6-dehydratase [Desulfobacterales bacterium]